MAMILQTSRLRLTQAIYFGEPPGTGGVTQLTPAADITMVPNPIIGVGTIGVTAGVFVKADGTVPLTADWDAGNFRIDSQNSTRWFNIIAYGASPADVDPPPPPGQTTNAFINAVAAAVAAGGGVVYVPRGTYRISSTITIPGPGVWIVGDGTDATTINFAPTAPGPCFLFSNGAATVNRCGIAGMTFGSADLAVQKTFVEVSDAVRFTAVHLSSANTTWTDAAADCIGIHVKGKQEIRISDCDITADLPIVIDSNPNLAGINEISFDHSSVESCELVVTAAATNSCITILDNTVLTNSSFRHLALAKGGSGISANSTAPAQAWQAIDIYDIRTEQGAVAAAYSIDLRHSGAQIQSLTIRNAVLDANRNGVRLTGCHWPVLDSVSYGGVGTFGNFSATVDALTIRNSLRQIGSSLTDASTHPVCIQFLDGGNVRNGFGTLSPSANPLSVTGILDATQVAVNTTTPTRTLDLNGTQRWRGIAAPAVSEANSATVYFDSASNKLKASLNGGAYVDVIGSAGLTGSGVANRIAYWDAATNLTSPLIYVNPVSNFLGVKVAVPVHAVDVDGDINLTTGSVIRVNAGTIINSVAATNIMAVGDGIGAVGLGTTVVGSTAMSGGTGTNATMVGQGAGDVTSGDANTGIGRFALMLNTTGARNTSIGHEAGYHNTTGSNNVFLGFESDATVGNLTNAVAVGFQALVAANDSMVLGNSAMKVGIRTGTPKTALDVDAAISTRHKNLSLAGGLNSDCALPDSSWVRIIDPAAPFSVGGFTNGVDGRMLTIYNTTAFQMSVDNEDMASTDVNRILTHTGLSINCVVASFIYEDVADRWILVNYV